MAGLNCPRCEEEVPAGSAFCSNCGKDLVEKVLNTEAFAIAALGLAVATALPAYLAVPWFVDAFLVRGWPAFLAGPLGFFEGFLWPWIAFLGYAASGRMSVPVDPAFYATSHKWAAAEAPPRLRLVAVFTVWLSSGIFFSLGLLDVMDPAAKSISPFLFDFVVYLLPVGLSFAVAKEASRFFRSRTGEVLADDAPTTERKPPRAGAKKADPTTLTESGFPASFREYVPPKTSGELRDEYLARQRDSRTARMERWQETPFSWYRVFGI